MPKGIKKENLPIKICLVCNKPFNWRKKWEKCWEEVMTCSKSCNAIRKALKHNAKACNVDRVVTNNTEEEVEY